MKRERNVSDITPEIARSQSAYDVGEMTWASVNSAGRKDGDSLLKDFVF